MINKKRITARGIGSYLSQNWMFYLMMLPGIVYFIVLHYVPMYGVSIAFRKFSIYAGFSDAPFIGLTNFEKLFAKPGFQRALSNNIIISLFKILVCFPAPILLSLMINEVRNAKCKKLVQTSVILPNFISWVVVSGLMYTIFSVNAGAIPTLLRSLGYQGKIRDILADSDTFRAVIVLSDMWKGSGIGTIIYLAAIAGVNQDLYEAASIDGANRLQQTWHVTLPAIRPIIITMLILRVGQIMDAGFDQIFAISNDMVKSVADIIDTYVYQLGMVQRNYSVATAAGLFKSLISLVLVIIANYISGRVDDSGRII